MSDDEDTGFSKSCPYCGAGPFTNPNELLAHVASEHP